MRGLGIGIVVTALLMTIINGGKQPELTDDQIRARAAALGMVDAGNLTLTERIGSEGAEGGTESTDSAAGETAEGTSEGTDGADGAAAGASVALEGDGTEAGEDSAAGAGDAAETGDGTETGENPVDQPAETQQPAETEDPVEAEEPAEAEVPVEAEVPAEMEDPVEEPAETEVPVEEPQQETPQPEPPALTGSTATITVRSGYGSERIAQLCKDAGLVESAADFDDFLVKNGYSTSLRVGTFHIPMGSNYTEIAKILSGRN